MINDLIGFFTGAPQNRRRYPRRPGPFKAWAAAGTNWATIVCMDISGSGLGLIAPTECGPEANFRVQLDTKAIIIRAKRVWQTPGTLQGKPAWRYGYTFTGISADDWDTVVRFCNNDTVEIENKAQKELDLVRLQADDVARLIPKKLQDTLLSLLVERRRLAPLTDKNPLVQYLYGGIVKRNGANLHKLVIHSRIRDAATGDIVAFDTKFYFDDQGGNVQIDSD